MRHIHHPLKSTSLGRRNPARLHDRVLTQICRDEIRLCGVPPHRTHDRRPRPSSAGRVGSRRLSIWAPINGVALATEARAHIFRTDSVSSMTSSSSNSTWVASVPSASIIPRLKPPDPPRLACSISFTSTAARSQDGGDGLADAGNSPGRRRPLRSMRIRQPVRGEGVDQADAVVDAVHRRDRDRGTDFPVASTPSMTHSPSRTTVSV